LIYFLLNLSVSAIFNRLIELWSKYRLERLALLWAQRKGSAKVEVKK